MKWAALGLKVAKDVAARLRIDVGTIGASGLAAPAGAAPGESIVVALFALCMRVSGTQGVASGSALHRERRLAVADAEGACAAFPSPLTVPCLLIRSLAYCIRSL